MFEYEGVVERIVDGDTIDVDIDLGMHVHVHERLRLKGIDTPEIFGVKKDTPEYEAGMKAKIYLNNLIPCGSLVKVRTFKDRKGKYGRYIADVLYTDEESHLVNVAEALIEKGYGERSDG